ncbi:MAG TPA: PilZ domain-containing protein [Terriglobales bacterium]|nr:PilZ domain-containing protein [Terriglobales bacterium]
MNEPPIVKNQMKDWSVERRWKRFRVEMRLKVFVDKPGMPKFTFGQGNDISEGGMSAYVPLEMQTGESLELELMLPYSKESIRVVAKVCNKNGFRYGMEYTRIAAQDRETLVKALKNLNLTQ